VTVPESQIQELLSVSRTRRPPANESAGSNGGSSDPSELGEEKRAILRGVLRHAGVEPTKEVVERLIAAIEPLMAAFRLAASQSTRRERHDALRVLVRMADEEDPPVGMIRARIAKLSTFDLAEAEERAYRQWSRVFPGESLESGFDFAAWLQTAKEKKLLEAVRTFFTDGGVVVPGRARPSGKHSKPRLEPLVLGQARGAYSPSRAKTEASATSPENRPPSPGNGRPRADAADDLVMHLAMDWHLVTGLEPQPGRSDQSAFGDLVHHVFGWLGLGTAEQSLRRYWDDVQDAEIIPIKGGQLLR
jgi:hypothetical protein